MASSISFRFYPLLIFLFVLHIGITKFTSSNGASVNNYGHLKKTETSKDLNQLAGLNEKVISGDSNSGLCPKDFVFIGIHCYYFSKEKANSWSDASTLCKKRSSSNLAVIRASHENYQIRDYMKHKYANISDLEGWWIAGTDVANYGNWVWDTSYPIDEPIMFFDWCPGEPNDFGGEHCLSLLPQCNFRWNDRDCGFWGFRYICQTFPFNGPK